MRARCVAAVLQAAIAANGHVTDPGHWRRKYQLGQEQEVGNDLYAVLEATRIVGLLLAPLLPDLSSRILEQLAYPLETTGWRSQLSWGGLSSGCALPTPSPVMQRLELEEPL